MKKLAIYLTASLALLLASCSSGSDDSSSVTTIRVKGTAKAKDASASTFTRAAGQQFGIDSIDSFSVNGTDIKDQLVAPSGTTAGQHNVEFTAQVEVPEMTTIEAAARAGYIFDEWEVREEDGADEALLDEIDDWLDKNDREHSEELVDVPKRYLPYLMAEYDYGFYVNLDASAPEGLGTKNEPYNKHGLTVKLRKDKDAGIKMDELSLVLGCSSSTPVIDVKTFVSGLVTSLGTGTQLKELKLKIAPDVNVEVNFPDVSNLEELKLSDFKFTDAVTIDNATTEYQFENCVFPTDLTVTNATDIEIKGGTAANITISNVEDVEIKDGTATKITISSAKEVEIESMTITDTLDLSAMTSGEVEVKKCSYGTFTRPGSGVELEER